MPQFNAYPAMQAQTFDLQGFQRQGLENQLLQSKLQQAQNPQPDPRLQLDQEKFEFSQDKDQRAQQLQHAKVLGQYAGAAAQASGVQRVMIHGEAVKYAQANGMSTDGWLDPSDSNYVAWAQAQQARAGEVEKQQTAEPQYGGEPQFDENVGKFYQTNPKTGKREYVASPSGMDFEVGPDGTVTMRTGVGRGGKRAGGMERKTKGTIEDKLMASANSLARMDTIRRKYKRKFLEWGPRINAKLLSWKSKFGQKLTPEQSQFVREISSFNRDSIENINLYIKEVTGAQMSEREADRIRLAQPDPGEGIFGGDAPEVFEAKLEGAYASIKRAQARYTYWLRKGVDMGDMTKSQLENFTRGNTLDGIEEIMRDREKEIIDQTRQSDPNISDGDLKTILMRTLSQEFGI